MSSIAFLGAGNIAQAIMGGLAQENDHLVAYDPVPECCDKAAAMGVQIASSIEDAVSRAEVVMLCVKPNVVAGLLTESTKMLSGKLIISVAAGITTTTMLAALGSNAAIVRCMPNTPALLRAGITGLFATTNVSAEQRHKADTILKGVGDTLWVSEETSLDIVTAVSGSGPAYFFLMIEALINAGVKEGLDRDTATQLALQTALGTAMMAKQSDETPEALRKNVTSPGGTTQAAIESFESGGLRSLVDNAVHAARVRSVELSKP